MKENYALLIEKIEDYFYLTGFLGEDSYCLKMNDKAYMIVDSRFTTQCKSQSNALVVEYSGNVDDTIEKILIEENIDTLMINEKYLSHERVLQLQKMPFKVECVGDYVGKERCLKKESEIELIRQAVEISDIAFENVLEYIKPGVTECEIAARIEYEMRIRGSKRPAFETIVASGKRGALPHGVASEKCIEIGDMITMDFGAYFKGYCSDITRTVALGRPKKELVEIYQIVLDANKYAQEGCRAGVNSRDVDALARNYIAKKGYGDYFGHGLGHGVGAEIHEAPRVSPRSDETLENGMVITIEPGIYIPELGGVRIEDTVVVRENAVEKLTKSCKDLIIL